MARIKNTPGALEPPGEGDLWRPNISYRSFCTSSGELDFDLPGLKTEFVFVNRYGTLLTMLNYGFDNLLMALEMAEVVTPSWRPTSASGNP